VRLGLAFRINVVIFTTLLVLGGSLGSWFVYTQDRALHESQDRRIRLLGGQFATYLAHEVDEGNLQELQDLLDAINDPEFAYALVKAPDGSVVAGRWSREIHGGVKEFAFPLRPATPGRDRVERGAFAPIEAEPAGPSVGTFALGVDLSGLRASRRQRVLAVVLATVLAALAASLVGALIVRLLLKRSVAPVLDGIRGLAVGDLSRRVAVRARRDELADIGQAFNDMADRLAETLVSKSDLEASVARRTGELTAALAERRRALEDVADREARVRLLLDSTAEAIFGIGADGLCTFCNAACARLLGYDAPEQLLGRNMHRLVHHHRREGQPIDERECAIYRTLQERRGYHSEDETFWRSDGSPIAVEVWSHPMARGGEAIGSVVTFLDVSERKRLEGEILKVRKLESLGVLAGGIAHDFNNLLMGILGNVALAKEPDVADGARSTLLAEAEQAAQRARHLTQQLLTFSKGGAPVKKVVALQPILEEAARFALSGAAVRADFSFPGNPWPVEADAGQLGQVVHNLILNAVQAMPTGGTIQVACENVQVAAGEVASLGPGPYVRLTVKDEGHGIPAEHLPRIFDPYFTTKAGGHGLGLASVYSIVKHHGGFVAVDSALGVGSRFTVYLPAAARAAAADAAPAPAPREHGGRVLVMDDEPAVRRVATAMLTRIGYEVEAVADGGEAVARARAAREAGRSFDVLVMDLTVPGGMGGVEAMAHLRAADPDAVAVATSGYANDPVMARCADFGFVAALAKPYTPADLSAAIAEARRVRQARKAAG
jgi:PAS domain S-box-containing protein